MTLQLRYTGFKEVIKVVALPDKPSVVALIDVDKVLIGDDFTFQKTYSIQGNLMDILQQKFLKSIPFWDGTQRCKKRQIYVSVLFFFQLVLIFFGKICICAI